MTHAVSHPIADPDRDLHDARDQRDQDRAHFETYGHTRDKGTDFLTRHRGAPREGHVAVTASRPGRGEAANSDPASLLPAGSETTPRGTHHAGAAASSRQPHAGVASGGVGCEDFATHLRNALTALRAAEKCEPPHLAGLGTAAIGAQVRSESLRVQSILRKVEDA